MTDHPTQIKCFCNQVAMEKGLDPIGSAGNFEDAVMFEHPFPWKYSYAEMGVAPEIMDLLDLWMQVYKETGVYGHRPLLIAPDANYSKEGFRRVMFYTKPKGLFSEFEKTEYLLPEDKIGTLIWAWYENPENLTQFNDYRQKEADTFRDILVCTHGAVDVACAKFGYPIYKYMRDNLANNDIRVWRVSHFGGHLYAPTLMDMPKGDYWAYVDNNIGERIIRRDENIQDLQGYYRGWAGVQAGFMQAMERACLMREGWQWQSYEKSGEIVAIDDSETPQWSEIRIDYITPQSMSASYLARVEIEQIITTHPASNDAREYAYPQYLVTKLEHLVLA